MFRDCIIAFSKLRDSYRAINPKLSYSLSRSVAKAESGRLSETYKEGLEEDIFDNFMLDGVFEALYELAKYQHGMEETLAEIAVALKSNVTSEALNPKVA